MLNPKDMWLNDEIIDFFFIGYIFRMEHLLNETQNLQYFNCYIPTYGTATIYSKDINKKPDFLPNYLWIYMSNYKDKFEVTSHTFLPVNIDNNHWILVIINWYNCKIEIYDSAYNNQKQKKYDVIFEDTKAYASLCREYFNVERCSVWTCVVMKDIPRQDNSIDCGLYVLLNSWYIYYNTPLTINSYNKEEVKNFRYNLIKMILQYEISTV